MLNKFIILGDGQYYIGCSDEIYESNYGGKGWHVSNNNGANVPVFSKDGSPKIIESELNLSSHLERIFRATRNGIIKWDSLNIVRQRSIKPEIWKAETVKCGICGYVRACVYPECAEDKLECPKCGKQSYQEVI